MSATSSVSVTPTSQAPKSISDLEALLSNDIKVKVAGKTFVYDGVDLVLTAL